MYLVTWYDFNKAEDRNKAWEAIVRDQPALVIGSPECEMFSGLQNLTKWNGYRQEKLEDAKKHLEFICDVYRHQAKEGRWFLHEHPSTATSWQEKCVLGIMELEGVSTTITDQCMFGLKTWDIEGKPALAKKRTRFMSSASDILTEIGKTCDNSHVHQQLLSGRAGPAAVYPPAWCRAMCKGLIKQLHMKRGK